MRGWLTPNGEENVRNEEERRYGERRRDGSRKRGKPSRLQIERARRRCIGIIIADTTEDRYRPKNRVAEYNEEFPDILELYKLEGIPELAIITIRARNKRKRDRDGTRKRKTL